MTWPYRIIPRANREYQNSIGFYELRQRGLGLRFVHDLETGKYIQTEDGDLELFGADEDD